MGESRARGLGSAAHYRRAAHGTDASGARELAGEEFGSAREAVRWPNPPEDDASLYPVDPDPISRRMLLEGVDGLRMVALSQLPWPHHLHRCAHVDRFRAVEASYPRISGRDRKRLGIEVDANRAANAEFFSGLSAADFAVCEFHAPDWAAIIDVVEEHADAMPVHAAVEAASEDLRLTEQQRFWARSLGGDPICWSDGADGLVNGQHRLCALRAAGVAAAPVDGRHLADQGVPPVVQPGAHARATVDLFWRQWVSAHWGDRAFARWMAGLLARNRWPRRLLVRRTLGNR